MNKILLICMLLCTLLTGCNNTTVNENTSTVESNTTEIITTNKGEEITTPDEISSYGSFMNIYRCINVDGEIEYLYNNIPFVYEGEKVSYYCTTNFEYKYNNGYEQDSIECMALLYYDGQYIDFSIEGNDTAFSHILVAENKPDDKYDETYFIDFEFSFLPYGIDKDIVNDFYLIVVPLYPLTVVDGEEVIDYMPVPIGGIKGSVVSENESLEYKGCTSITSEQINVNEDDINSFIKELNEIRKTGVNHIECVLLKRDNILENITLINKKEDKLDNTIVTLTICDNKIMRAFSDKDILFVNTTEDGIIKSYFDTSSLDKGKHTIFTITIIKDNIKDSFEVYRSNFVNIEVN